MRNFEGTLEWTNWEESIALEPSAVAFPRTVEEIAAVIRDTENYPSPVRPAGSRHSTTHCGTTDGGTLLILRRMDRIIAIDRDTMTVTAEAGALYIDVARALEREGLQFYVNVEIGNLTMGSAACTGTKDASMPGELGQVCSYCIGLRMVIATGETREITEEDGELMEAARSSYGLFGAIYEVTFRIRALAPMVVRHVTYDLDGFADALPELIAEGQSIMYYLYPHDDRLTIELRNYSELPRRRTNKSLWRFRNFFWKTGASTYGALATRLIPFHRLRYAMIDSFYRALALVLSRLLRSRWTVATDQIIRYPEHKNISKYTFSIWAFPEKDIIPTMQAYYQFCQDYYREYGYRCDLLNVGYRIAEDRNSIFSYSYNGAVMTLDPVSTGSEGWNDFLRAYNVFCSKHNGVPLFNQSKWLTRKQVRKAFGARVDTFWRHKTALDSDGRFTNAYFHGLFAPNAKCRPDERSATPFADDVTVTPVQATA